MAITNPNGANQWVADPRQQLFLAYYKDPKSSTFSNAKQSAIRAGFSEQYADNIMAKMPDWLAEMVGQSRLLMKAERNLEEMLDLPSKTQAMGAFGPVYEHVKVKKKGSRKTTIIKKKVMVHNKGLMALKNDASKFIAEGIGRKKYGKKEGNDGDVYNVVIFANEQRRKIASRIVGGGSASGPSS